MLLSRQASVRAMTGSTSGAANWRSRAYETRPGETILVDFSPVLGCFVLLISGRPHRINILATASDLGNLQVHYHICDSLRSAKAASFI
jgi:hypothetical protein